MLHIWWTVVSLSLTYCWWGCTAWQWLPETAEPFLRKVNFIRHLPGDLVKYKKYAEFKRRTGKEACLSIWAVESCNSSKNFWGIIILICHYIVTMERKQCCIWNGSSVHCHSEQGHLLSTLLLLRWNIVTKETYKRKSLFGPLVPEPVILEKTHDVKNRDLRVLILNHKHETERQLKMGEVLKLTKPTHLQQHTSSHKTMSFFFFKTMPLKPF